MEASNTNMMYDHLHREAVPRARSTCPHCDGDLIAKCGPIVTWHWAHIASDCDPWTEPESQWHIDWKKWFELHRGARIEVPMGAHRADVVLPDGNIIELQSGYLSVIDILNREAFYGPGLSWLYRVHWMQRLHFGKKGFWWKQGAKSMTEHRQPVWWHMNDELIRVRMNLVIHVEDQWGTTTERVLGSILRRRPAPDLYAPLPPPPRLEPDEQLSLLPSLS